MESLERWQKKDWKPHELVRMGWILVAALLVLTGIVTSWYTVAPEEEAVVLRCGRYSTTTPPGLHFKLPFFIDEAIKVPVTEVRKLEFGFRTIKPGRRSTFRTRLDEALMLTGDLNIAEVEWVVQYKIKDAREWIFNVREQEDTIHDLSESVMRAVVGDHTVTEVLTRERAKIATEARDVLQERFNYYKMGVQVVTVQLQNAHPPQAVRASFDDVNAAQQERSRLENEAKREYNKVIQVALGEAKRAVSEAEGYAADRVNRAGGDIARFSEILQVYQASKEVTRRRLYLETIEEVLPRVKEIVVVSEEGVLKHLPLGKGGAR
ncbi:MAG: FtsH protease activity modulator HflK [Planctomycetota bacterium]|jgi:membrane protease subunit HflK